MDVNKILGIIHSHDGDAVELAKSLGGALEKRRAQTAKKRAGGQELPPSKFMPNVPRAVHATEGRVVIPHGDPRREENLASFQNGNHPDVPHVLYHGTTGDFSEFLNRMAGSSTGAKSAKMGHWFTDSPRVAKSYADYSATNAPVAKLLEQANHAGNKQNWDLHDKLITEAENLENQFGDIENRKRGQNIMPVHLAMKKPYIVDANNGEFEDLEGGLTKHILAAKAKGHDGIIIKNLDDAAGLTDVPANHYLVFDPRQIKSATGNNGDFDPSNPDIRKEYGGSVEPVAHLVEHVVKSEGGEVEGHALELARHAGDAKGDTILAHINPQEAAMLKRMGGSGTINPKTGLPQFSVDGNGPEAGSTGSAAGNSYGGNDSPSESGPGPGMGGGNGNNSGSGNGGGSDNWGGGNGGGRDTAGIGNNSNGIGNIGIGSMVAMGNPSMASTFGKEDQGVSNDEQLAKDFAGASAAFLAGMPGTQLAKDYVASATGNSPMADPFVGSSNPEANRVIAPDMSPTMQVPAGLTNKQIVAMMRETPAPAGSPATPVQSAADNALPDLSQYTTPSKIATISDMPNAIEQYRSALNDITVPSGTIIGNVNAGAYANDPTSSYYQPNSQVAQSITNTMANIPSLQGSTITGGSTLLSGDQLAAAQKMASQPYTAPQSAMPEGAVGSMTLNPSSFVSFSDVPTPPSRSETFGEQPAQVEQAYGLNSFESALQNQPQYAQPSFPHTETPSSAYAQQNTPVGNGNVGQVPQQVAANFPQNQSSGRGSDTMPNSSKKPRYWLNPATGKVELIPENQVMARGGKASNDWESMIRHALDVAFRYGS